MTAVKTNLAEVDAYHTPFQPTSSVQASTVQDAARILTPLRGAFSLTTNSNTTTLSIAGMLASSQFDICLQPGASEGASNMLPFITIQSQGAGTITLSHPQTAATLNYNYQVQI